MTHQRLLLNALTERDQERDANRRLQRRVAELERELAAARGQRGIIRTDDKVRLHVKRADGTISDLGSYLALEDDAESAVFLVSRRSDNVGPLMLRLDRETS